MCVLCDVGLLGFADAVKRGKTASLDELLEETEALVVRCWSTKVSAGSSAVDKEALIVRNILPSASPCLTESD